VYYDDHGNDDNGDDDDINSIITNWEAIGVYFLDFTHRLVLF
jgi:hypothetical protein